MADHESHGGASEHEKSHSSQNIVDKFVDFVFEAPVKITTELAVPIVDQNVGGMVKGTLQDTLGPLPPGGKPIDLGSGGGGHAKAAHGGGHH